MKKKDLKLIEQDESKLYRYLVNLAKSEEGSSNVFLFEKYLNHNSEELRSAAIFSLLFVLKIANEAYRQEALKYVTDKTADFDLRQWSISGLAQTYFGKDDIQLLQLYLKHLNDSTEDEDIKPAFLRGLLNLHGVKSKNIFLKVGAFNKVNNQILTSFSPEISEINNLIRKGP